MSDKTDQERVLEYLRERLLDAEITLEYTEERARRLVTYISQIQDDLAAAENNDADVIADKLECIEMGERP